MMEQRSAAVNGLTVNYGEGPPNGPPLLLLHGSTSDWRDLGPLLPALQPHWHLYATDLRGHGQTDWTDAGYRAVDFFPDTIAFVQEQIGRPAMLLGHSLGAIVALGAAAAVPAQIRALILLDPPLRHLDTPMSKLVAGHWFRGVLGVLEGTQAPDTVFRRFFPETDQAGVRALAERVSTVDPRSVEVLLNDQFYDGFELTPLLSRVTCPALLLYGQLERGGLVRPADAVVFERQVSQGTAVQIEGAGHLLQWEQPERVLAQIAQFIARL